MKFDRLKAALHRQCASTYERLAEDRATRSRYHDRRARLLGHPRRRRTR